MPKLKRILLESTDDELLKSCTVTVRNLLRLDHRQVFEWRDEQNKVGLENVLLIIDRLLSPTTDDNAAAEVGGLAAELVDKAGAEKLGPYFMQLLHGVALRLSSAEKPHLIQSLSSVFARLSTTVPGDVVTFLSQVDLGGADALQSVMTKWLENSSVFVGYEDIRQNVAALCTLYNLHDARLEKLTVKGDLVVPHSDQIMTRSKARKNPDQYTITSVPVKIVKVLAAELGIGRPRLNGSDANLDAIEQEIGEEDESGEDEWEDEPDELGLGFGLGVSKQELLAFAEEEPGSQRQTDDETQAYLEQFFQNITQDGDFSTLCSALTPQELEKIRSVVR